MLIPTHYTPWSENHSCSITTPPELLNRWSLWNSSVSQCYLWIMILFIARSFDSQNICDLVLRCPDFLTSSCSQHSASLPAPCSAPLGQSAVYWSCRALQCGRACLDCSPHSLFRALSQPLETSKVPRENCHGLVLELPELKTLPWAHNSKHWASGSHLSSCSQHSWPLFTQITWC